MESAEEKIKGYEEMVKGPGKFEGCARYVPYFWDAFLDGCADSDNGKVLTFRVSREDKILFAELKRRQSVKLYEDGSGFVYEV